MPIYWIGVDEAGYGARLGPLVVSASSWQIDHPPWTAEQIREDAFLSIADQWSWQEQFRSQTKVTDQATGPTSSPATAPPLPSPLLVADSKKVYHSGQGLEALRQIVTSLLSAIEATELPGLKSTSRPTTNTKLDSIIQRPLAGGGDPWATACLTYDQHAKRVSSAHGDSATRPYWLEGFGHGDDLDSNTDSANDSLYSTDGPSQASTQWHTPRLRPQKLSSAILSEWDFNRGLTKYGNKANLLSATSMQLANHLLQQCPVDCDVVIDFDRHGGRKRYLPMLMEYFPADWLMVVAENPLESSYYWDCGNRRVYFRFSVDGERRYPVAVASLASKYGRELGMACVNTFWQQRVPKLRTSAGYPVDAARMLDELRTHFANLPVPINAIWREA